MQPHKKSFFEDFSIAFSKPQIWEKCRLLSLLLPRGTPNELHVVFSQICGDVFGKKNLNSRIKYQLFSKNIILFF